MAYQSIYRLQAKNNEGQLIIIHVSDRDSGVGTPTYHDLKLMSCNIEVSNSEDDRFSVVASNTLSFVFVPTQTYALNTFREGGDNRFFVEVFMANTSIPIFKGFLLTDLTTEALLPKSTGGEWAMTGVELTATDNLPTLKELPLTNVDGINPRGLYKPIHYISWCLQKTGLELPINIVDGIVYTVDPSTAGNWYNTTLLWSKTFEADINESIGCYETLETILKGRVIFQYLGEWWIISREEMIGGAYNIFKYDFEGNYLTLDSNTYTKQIGKTQPLKLAGKDAEVYPERANKYVLMDFPYELPREIIDNYDFVRDKTTPIFTGSYVDPDDGITKEEKRYTLEDWTIGRYAINSEVAVSAASISPFIRRIFYPTGYEVQRYIVMPVTNQSSPNVYLRSNAVPVGQRDRLIFSVDFKYTSTGVSDFQNIWYALLKGEDGNYYWYNPASPGVWQNTSIYAVPTAGTFSYSYHYTDSPSKVKWASLGYDMSEVPVNGEVYIFLGTRFDSSLVGEVHYQNISIDYLPCINGSFSKYRSQFHKVSQAGNLKANREESVVVTDSPKKLFKGALRHQTGASTFPLVGSAFWHYPSGSPVLEKFGRYQAYDYWHQFFNPTCKIQGSLTGLESFTNPSNMPGLIHQYEFDFTTNDEHTADRWFCLLSYKQDLIAGAWSGVFAEVVNTTVGHPYSGTHETGYTSE